MRVRTSIHPAVWISRWNNANAPVALEHASRLGLDHVVVPLRRFEDIDPPFIAKTFAKFGMTPVNAAGQTSDADVSSVDAETRRRGFERLRHAVRLARDMGSTHVGGLAADHADALAIWRDTFEDGDAFALQSLDLIHRPFDRQ